MRPGPIDPHLFLGNKDSCLRVGYLTGLIKFDHLNSTRNETWVDEPWLFLCYVVF